MKRNYHSIFIQSFEMAKERDKRTGKAVTVDAKGQFMNPSSYLSLTEPQ
jgi:hypothetical protein